jgi:hypothetical protein
MARVARAAQVGILVECGPDGLEVHFCRRICALLRDQHGARFEERFVPMDNKRRLLEEAATVARTLRTEGCDRVVILWDEEPAWPKKRPLCWHTERAQLLASLRGAEVDAQFVHLVCIERTIESWLMYDAPLLCRVLSRPTHQARVKTSANPHRLNNAKGVLMKIFREHRQAYVDVMWAARLAANLEDLNRLLRCETFARFAERVMGRSL